MQVSRKLLALAFLFALFCAALPSLSVAQDDSDELDVSEGVDSSRSSSDVLTDLESDEYDEESEEVEEQQQMYVMPASDVQTYVKFLGVSDNKFTAGDEVTALIGMTNSGPNTYNVSFVGAHLHSPYDFNFYIQNFTVRWTSNLLPPRSEVTVEYRFRPDEKLEPLDFHLSGWLIYNDSAATPIIYRSMFVNQTIEVLEARAEWTVQSAVSYTLVFAGLGIVGYVFLSQTDVGKTVGKKTKRAVANSTGDAAPAPVWDTKVYRPASVQKAVGAKKSNKSKQ